MLLNLFLPWIASARFGTSTCSTSTTASSTNGNAILAVGAVRVTVVAVAGSSDGTNSVYATYGTGRYAFVWFSGDLR